MIKTAQTQKEQGITYLQNDGKIVQQSFSELLAHANAMALNLLSQQLPTRSPVILYLEHPIEILTAFWGCLFAQHIPVITAIAKQNTPNSNEIQKLINVWTLLEEPIVICDEQHQASLSQLDTLKNSRKGNRVIPYPSLHQSETGNVEANVIETNKIHPDDVAFMCLSSGSTGTPKCIQMTHRNVIARGRGANSAMQASQQDVILNWLPFDHIGSISDWHIRCIDLGCSMVYCSKEHVLSDPLNWLHTINQYRISHTWAPNFAYENVNSTLKDNKYNHGWDLQCVKLFLTAAESVSGSTTKQFLHLLKPYGLHTNVITPAFGMAEMGSGVNYALRPTPSLTSANDNQDNTPQEGDLPKEGLSKDKFSKDRFSKDNVKEVFIDRDSLKGTLRFVGEKHPNAVAITNLGPIIDGMSMRIVDDHNHIVSEGIIGRLHMKGVAVTPGYFNNPEANRIFLEDGWMDTGDKGFLLDGDLYLSGRTKDIIIINGKNYFPSEIEKLVDNTEGTLTSFSAAISVRSLDTGEECLAVIFSPEYWNTLDLIKTMKHIHEEISQSIGVAIEYLIPLKPDSIPKTPIGKIQRSKMVTEFAQGNYHDSLKQADILLNNHRVIPDWFIEWGWYAKDNIKSSKDIHFNQSGQTLFFTDDSKSPASWMHQPDHYSHPQQVIDIAHTYHPKQDKANNIDFFQQVLDHAKQLLPELSSTLVMVISEKTLSEQPLENLLINARDFCFAAKTYGQEHNLANIVLLIHSPHTETTSQVQQRGAALSAFYHCALQPLTATPLNVNIKTIFLQSNATSSDKPSSEQRTSEQRTSDQYTSNPFMVDRMAIALSKEIHDCCSEREIQLLVHENRAERKVKHFRAATPTPSSDSPFNPQDLIILFGGLGGIGYELSKWLINTFDVNLLIIGRTQLDKQNSKSQLIQSRLQELNSIGKVHYDTYDLSDKELINECISQLENKQSVTAKAIFHLAGQVREMPLDQYTDAFIEQDIHAKIEGANTAVHLATLHPHIRAYFFSSTLSEIPASLSPVYAAANRYIDELALHAREQHGLACSSFAWSQWQGIGMSADQSTPLEPSTSGLHSIDVNDGLITLKSLLTLPPCNRMVGVARTAPSVAALNTETITSTTSMGFGFINPQQTKKTPSRITLNGSFASQAFECSAIEFSEHSPVCSSNSVSSEAHRDTKNIDPKQLRYYLTYTGNDPAIKPETDIEQRIFTLWSSILHRDDFGVTDNFFALGGQSISAVQLAHQLNDMFDTQLPMSLAFEEKTIREQAKRIGGTSEQEDNADIIPLNSNNPSSPLFFICGIELYKELAQHLEGKIPAYGVYLPIEGKLLSNHQSSQELSVENMAKQYIEAIKQIQPEGPYRLAGVSFGGVIAFEIARQLRQYNETIELLTLLDFVLPEPEYRASAPNSFQKALFTLHKHWQYFQRNRKQYKFNKMSDSGINNVNVRNAYEEAWWRYEKQATPMDISDATLVFKAGLENKGFGYTKSTDCGWSHYTLGTPESHSISGDHLGILKGENAKMIAEKIVNRVQA
nr:AMP-binding protein [Marinibactrum halimedae]